MGLFSLSTLCLQIKYLIHHHPFWDYLQGAPGERGPMGFPGVTVCASHRFTNMFTAKHYQLNLHLTIRFITG